MSDSDFDDDIDKLLNEFDKKSQSKEDEASNTKYRPTRPTSANIKTELSTQRQISPKKSLAPVSSNAQKPAPTVAPKPGSFLGGLSRDRDSTEKKSDTDWLGLGPATEPSPLPTPIASRKLPEQVKPKEKAEGGRSEENFDEDSFLKKLSTLKSKREESFPVSKPATELPKQQRSMQIPATRNPIPSEVKPQMQVHASNDERPSERTTPIPTFMAKLNIPTGRSHSADPDSLDLIGTGSGDPGAGGSQKKRVLVKKSSTLQVPSHLIDEEELKLMSTSLKTLYGNQVEMIEKSYKEQLDCQSQSFARKEEMLKEENRMMQKEYEVRINKLKTDLMEFETKSIQRIHSDANNYSSIMEQLKLIQAQNQTLSIKSHETNFPEVQNLAQEINSNLNSRFIEFLGTISNKMENIFASKERIQASSLIIPETNIMVEKLDKVSNMLENAMKQWKPESQNKSKDKETKVETELSKLLKEQKKLRTTLIKTTVTAMTQSLESNNQNQRKKDKFSTQMKEFRKDFQRVMLEVDLKNESVQKSQVLLQSQQKTMLQSFHDLTTFLQMGAWSMNNRIPGRTENFTSQESIQNEYELKLLRDERNSLSEKIAALNVDRRKLNDERIQIENDKRDFERDKLKVHDLETMLKIKIADAENMKKEAEILRLENIKLNGQLSKKLNDLDREHLFNRDFECNLQHQRQKHLFELSEIHREKEILEKLRQELLCPSCLKFIPLRSRGDGIDETMKLFYAPTLPKINFDEF